MKSVFLVGFIFMVSTVLIACSNPRLEDYQSRQPPLELESFFTGDLVAYGMVRDRNGRQLRTFTAALKGSWDKGVGTLDEVFWFDDGERQTRIWTMAPDASGHYRGTALDVVGEAEIRTAGNAIHLTYRLEIPYGDGTLTVSMDDWMYQIAPGVILNETLMSKWGFRVGTVTLAIIKIDALDAMPQLIEKFDRSETPEALR